MGSFLHYHPSIVERSIRVVQESMNQCCLRNCDIKVSFSNHTFKIFSGLKKAAAPPAVAKNNKVVA